MFLIRSAAPADFKFLRKLARLLNSYNLPADSNFLRRLLRDSVDSFQNRSLPVERRRFLLVAEDIRLKQVVGCSLIIARHGTPRLPHLAFRVRREVKKSRVPRRSIVHQTLQLTVNRSGFTEIGGLVLLPAYRHRPERLAIQLSYARFAYMAWHPEQFRRRVLVEYLPKLDLRNGNQFWRVLGARFTGLSYWEADRLSAFDKGFVLSLFPKEKIYCDLLPKSAIQNLGVPGAGAQASLSALRKLGFHDLNQVDPFDGGPHFSAMLKKISVVRKTRFLRYGGENLFGKPSGRPALLMTVKEGKMRAIVTGYRMKKSSVTIDPIVAKALCLKVGDRVSLTKLGP